METWIAHAGKLPSVYEGIPRDVCLAPRKKRFRRHQSKDRHGRVTHPESAIPPDAGQQQLRRARLSTVAEQGRRPAPRELSQCHARFPVVNPLTRMTAGTAHSLSDMFRSTGPSAQVRQEPRVPRVKIMRTRTRRWAERPGTRPKVRLLSSIPPEPEEEPSITTASNVTMRASRDRPAPIRNHENRRHPNLVGKKTKTSRPTEQHQNTAHQYRQPERNPPTDGPSAFHKPPHRQSTTQNA